MKEFLQNKERNAVEDNLSDLRVRDQSEEDDDVGLSRLRVNIRRPDSSIAMGVYLGKFWYFLKENAKCTIFLEDEFLNFLRINFPQYREKMVTVPGLSFQYKLPGNQHGIPSKAGDIRIKKIAEEENISQAGSNCKATHSSEDHMSVGKQKKNIQGNNFDIFNLVLTSNVIRWHPFKCQILDLMVYK